MSTAQVMQDVDDLLAYQEELLARGLPAGATLIVIGCALGVRMSGGRS
jgi:hypothetical protein